ncbi:hypothetical protein RchiOBHm_Chr2g0096401 [Rosa chinensis]|uniref:Uncharacterized protein n=1 Tax=Rosa chinensis TaxID=74649 RepID=A0A2P6RL23_ROSCH|nr:hypothetical protein RchiOBHm_Chr2g0096401 [Rosa chinensis]
MHLPPFSMAGYFGIIFDVVSIEYGCGHLSSPSEFLGAIAAGAVLYCGLGFANPIGFRWEIFSYYAFPGGVSGQIHI